MAGLKVDLLPDFERALSPKLIIAALGSAFFSLSLGVGTMLIHGSYISDKENLPVLGGPVTGADISIALLAGVLVAASHECGPSIAPYTDSLRQAP